MNFDKKIERNDFNHIGARVPGALEVVSMKIEDGALSVCDTRTHYP
jgi:hypothetical protein